MKEIWSKVLTLAGVGTNTRNLLENMIPFSTDDKLQDLKTIKQI